MQQSYPIEKNKKEKPAVLLPGDIDDLIFSGEEWHESEK